MSLRRLASFAAVVPALLLACSSSDGGSPGGGEATNPFLDDQTPSGKADTAYMNPDGIEVEVDIEADVEAPTYRLLESPAFVAQFATTYLRERKEFYLESLAEDTTSKNRVEWLVDGNWITAGEAASADKTKLKRFRIKGVNAVLLHEARQGVSQGTVFEAEVPIKPFSVMSEAGDKCATYDSHMPLSQIGVLVPLEPGEVGLRAAHPAAEADRVRRCSRSLTRPIPSSTNSPPTARSPPWCCSDRSATAPSTIRRPASVT